MNKFLHDCAITWFEYADEWLFKYSDWERAERAERYGCKLLLEACYNW